MKNKRQNKIKNPEKQKTKWGKPLGIHVQFFKLCVCVCDVWEFWHAWGSAHVWQWEGNLRCSPYLVLCLREYLLYFALSPVSFQGFCHLHLLSHCRSTAFTDTNFHVWLYELWSSDLHCQRVTSWDHSAAHMQKFLSQPSQSTPAIYKNNFFPMFY